MPSIHHIRNEVKNYLSSKFMFVVDEWLDGFVEHLSNEGTTQQSEFNTLAYDQWLLNDLKDISPGSLPQNLASKLKTTLGGKHVLQCNFVMDIGMAAYQQLQILRKVNIENVEATKRAEDKIPSHRMIKLHLTDGVQDITAIEYRPMRNLSCDMIPGCKLLIKGPVICRRGMLLLEEKHVEVLGGEAGEDMLLTNSMASLLSQKLGCDPAQNSISSNIPNLIPQPPPSVMNQNSVNRQLPNINIEPPNIQSKPIARVTSIQVSENDFDEDIDLDQLAELENQIYNTTSNKQSTNIETNILKHGNPAKKMRMDNISKCQTSNSKLEQFRHVDNSNSKISVPLNSIDEFPDYDDLIPTDEFISELESERLPRIIAAEPFVYIKQINDMGDVEKAGKVFYVKGQILTLLSKLSIGKSGWSLKCTIIDGSGTLDVDFTSDVLTKIVGITPAEMGRIKSDLATKPEVKEKAINALEKAKEALQILYCILEITYIDTPKVTALIDYTEMHATNLFKRSIN